MLKITYTNGDVQNVNVTGDFFTITLVPSNGKPIKLTPTQKAEAFAFDMADQRKTQVSSIEIFFPEHPEPKVKHYRLVDDREKPETGKPSPAYIKDLKAMKREHRHLVPTNKKGYKTYWKWTF